MSGIVDAIDCWSEPGAFATFNFSRSGATLADAIRICGKVSVIQGDPFVDLNDPCIQSVLDGQARQPLIQQNPMLTRAPPLQTPSPVPSKTPKPTPKPTKKPKPPSKTPTPQPTTLPGVSSTPVAQTTLVPLTGAPGTTPAAPTTTLPGVGSTPVAQTTPVPVTPAPGTTPAAPTTTLPGTSTALLATSTSPPTSQPPVCSDVIPPGLFNASTLLCNTTLDFTTFGLYSVKGNYTYTGNIILNCNSTLGVRFDMYGNPDRLRVYATNGSLVFDSGYFGTDYVGCDGPLPINSGPLLVGCQGLSGGERNFYQAECSATPALNVSRAPTIMPEAYTFTVDSPCVGSSWSVHFDCTSPPSLTANETTAPVTSSAPPSTTINPPSTIAAPSTSTPPLTGNMANAFFFNSGPALGEFDFQHAPLSFQMRSGNSAYTPGPALQESDPTDQKRVLVYGSDSLNTSIRAEASVTYATVQPVDNTIGNETYGIFFAGGAGNGAYAYDFNTGSRLQIGTIISQGGPTGNYSASFIWSYRNMTIVRDYNFTIIIPKSAFGSTTSLQAEKQAASEETPCDPLLEKVVAACELLGPPEQKDQAAKWLTSLDMVNMGLQAGESVEGAVIEGEVSGIEAEGADFYTKIPGLAILSILFTALDIACTPIELASCHEKLPGCQAECQDAPMEKTLFSEVVCINTCIMIYPDPCCPISPPFGRFFCEALSPSACNIGCGVCGLNEWP